MKLKINLNLCKVSEELIKNRNSGISMVNCLTDIVDKIVISIFNEVTAILGFSENLALVAIGGYGRQEISPFSDIDIMFLVKNEERNIVAIVHSMLYKLWDNGLNISHSFRTQKDLIKDAMKDLEVRTSLMEGRFVAGGYELFREFKRDIYPNLLYRDKQKLLRDILTDINNRHKKYDNSLHLLEPNIKEGNGGLRDAHSGLWLARAVLSINNIQDYNKIVSQSSYLLFLRAYNFLLKIRVGLHIVSQRKNEILSYEFHQSVSHLLGFKDTEQHLAPEIMMRLYYTNIKNIKNIVSIIINMCSKKQSRFSISFSVKRIGNSKFYLSKNKIIVKDEKVLQTSEGILEAFYIYSITDKDFSFKTKEFIVDKMILVEKIPLSQRVIDLWIKILRGDRVYETLRQMYETRVLDRLIPEFKRLINLVIFEPYHKYTVDEHTLLTIKALESLIQTKDKTLSHIREIFIKSNREIIFLALILHDIGKGLYQKHEKMGYIVIKNIVERFNIGYQDRSKIEFLVKNHTLLAKLALTRDIDSKETISNIVEKIDNIETLDMLYLMTYSDMKATSPSFWTIWKGHLLYIMYLKIKEYIDGIQKQSFIALPNEDIKKILKKYAKAIPCREYPR